MDADRFAAFLAAFTAAPSRRAALRVLGGLGLARLVGQTNAKNKKKHKKKCAKAGQTPNKKRKRCCSGLIQDGNGVCGSPIPTSAPGCTPATCAGCCTGETCQPGTDTAACGTGGGACQSCSPCQTCTSGVCEAAANRTTCGGSNICCNGICCDGCCGADGSCGACLVFITSTSHTGDLDGLAGADAICQTRARSVSPDLPGSYKAWLSTGTGAGRSPATRFRRSGQPYRLVNSTNSIAASYADLIDGTLANPITLTETGNGVGEGWAWTNTAVNGAVDSTFPAVDCNDWTVGTNASSGSFGVPGATTSSWTDIASTYCDIPAHLYCFQQD